MGQGIVSVMAILRQSFHRQHFWCQNVDMGKSLITCAGCCVLITLSILMGLAAAADSILVPGVRCGPYILGKTTERDVAAMPQAKGIDLQYSKEGVLRSLVLTVQDYETDRHIRVGATEDEVVRTYGHGEVGNIDLAKGTTSDGNPVVIGKVGDKVLFYPGIQFVFAKQRVWAIILVKK